MPMSTPDEADLENFSQLEFMVFYICKKKDKAECEANLFSVLLLPKLRTGYNPQT